jgi:hypothetical protein
MTRKLLILCCLMATVFISYANKKKKAERQQAAPTQTGTQEPVFDPVDYKSIGSPLPKMRVVTAKKEVFTEKELVNDANLVVMLFNPTCDHCQYVTRYLMGNIDKFKRSNVVLMATPNMIGTWLENFNAETDVYTVPKIKVGVDSADFITKTYNYVGLPQVNVYREGKLLKQFNFETAGDSVMKYVE